MKYNRITESVIDILATTHEGGVVGYNQAFLYWCAALQGIPLPSDTWFVSQYSKLPFDIINHIDMYHNSSLLVNELVSIGYLSEQEQKEYMRELGLPLHCHIQFLRFLKKIESLSHQQTIGVDGSLLTLSELLPRSFALVEQDRRTKNEITDPRIR